MNAKLQILNVRTVTGKKSGNAMAVAQAIEQPGPECSLRGLVEFFPPDGVVVKIGEIFPAKVTEFRGLYNGVAQISVLPAK